MSLKDQTESMSGQYLMQSVKESEDAILAIVVSYLNSTNKGHYLIKHKPCPKYLLLQKRYVLNGPENEQLKHCL